MAAPMDLNVPYTEKAVLEKKIKMAYQLGYEAVALNVFMPDLTKQKQKKKDKEVDKAPKILPPEKIKFSEEELKSILGPTRKPFKQFTRISTILDEPPHNRILSEDAVQKYDLIAVQPMNDKTFHGCELTDIIEERVLLMLTLEELHYSQMNVDIITIDVTAKLDFKLKRSTLSAAMARGIVFELQYGPAIRDSTLRGYFISNAQNLMFWGKGKNVILTSGCEKAIELRGPYDVANLGLLLNLNEKQSKDAVTTNCRSVLFHSESRRLNKSVSKVEKIDDLPVEDAWLASKTDIEQCETGDMDSDDEEDSDAEEDRDIADIHGEQSSEEEEDVPVQKKMKLSQT